MSNYFPLAAIIAFLLFIVVVLLIVKNRPKVNVKVGFGKVFEVKICLQDKDEDKD